MQRRLLPLARALAGLAASSSVENPVTGKTERTVTDERSEIAEGQKQHRQVLAEYGEVKARAAFASRRSRLSLHRRRQRRGQCLRPVYGAADAQALQRYHLQLREAEGSFRALSPGECAAARPWSLRTVPFPRGGLRELARQSPLPNAEAQLRLLDGVYPGGEPQPGERVKIVE